MRKALPPEFAYIIEELLHETPSGESKQMYYAQVVETIISCGQAKEFIIAICNVIQRLSIDSLHILGDIYDRGQGAHIILDTLQGYKNYDIQWATTTRSGWEPAPATTAASPTCCGTLSATATWTPSRRATAST